MDLYRALDETERYRLHCWSTVFIITFVKWQIILRLPPGTKVVESTYRLHFLHGLLCSVLCALYFYDFVEDYIVTMTSLSYFVVDLVNMIFNDFIYKVQYISHISCHMNRHWTPWLLMVHFIQVVPYQRGENRIMEYVHHVLTTIGIVTVQFDRIHGRQSICNINIPQNVI